MGCAQFYTLACPQGYNFNRGKCCNYAAVTFGWTMFAFFWLFVFFAILCAIRRKRMQQRQMYYQQMAMNQQPREQVVITQTSYGQTQGTYSQGYNQ